MRRYYITDRLTCPDILGSIHRAAESGVDFIQIREKDLNSRDLFDLTLAAVNTIRAWPTRVLVNGRVDIALAAGAHGVHLPARSILPAEFRRIAPSGFLIAVSCHTTTELGEAEGADFAVYGPVFDTPGKGPPIGLDSLREAARTSRSRFTPWGSFRRECPLLSPRWSGRNRRDPAVSELFAVKEMPYAVRLTRTY